MKMSNVILKCVYAIHILLKYFKLFIHVCVLRKSVAKGFLIIKGLDGEMMFSFESLR